MGEALGFGVVFSIQDLFSSTADKISAKFNQLEGVSESASAGISKAINRIESGLAITGIGAGLVAPLALATNKAMDFEAQLSSIVSVAPELGSSMDAIKQATMQAGADTKYSALEAAQGFEELVKAGVDSKVILGGGLTDALNLATAGEIAVKDAAEIASTALNAFKADQLSVGMAGNILAGAANASATSVGELKFGLSAVSAVASGAGVSFKDTATALAVLAQNGIKGSDAGTSLKSMFSQLSPKTKEATVQMQQLGIIARDGSNAFFDSQGNLKSLADVAGILEASLSKLNPKERGDALQKMFGSDGVRAANVFFKTSIGGFNDMAKAMDKVNMKSAAEQRMNNLKGSIEQFKGNFETILINIGLALTPILKNIVDFGTKMLQVFNRIAESSFGKYIVYVLGALGGFLVALGSVVTLAGTFGLVWNSALPILRSLQVAFMGLNISMLPIIVTVGIVAGVIIGLREAYLSFQEVMNGGKAESGFLGVVQKIGGVITGVIELFGNATTTGFEFSEQMYQAFEKIGIADFMVGLGTWIVRLKAMFEGARQGVIMIYNIAIAPLVEGFGRVGQALSPLFDMFGRLFNDGRMVKSTSDVQTWVEVVRTGFQVVAYAIDFLLTPIRFGIELIGVAISYVTNFGNAFINIYDEIVANIDLWKQGWISLPEMFGNIGSAIVNNLKAGFLGTWESFKTAVSNAIEGLPFGLGGFLKDKLGLGVEATTNTNTNTVNSSFIDSALPQQAAQQTKEARQNSYSFNPTIQNNIPPYMPPNMTVVLEGEPVGRIIEDRNKFESNRRND